MTEPQLLIPSISYNQHDIIRWIIELHLDGLSIECDPCFGNGNFYPDDINIPYYCYDINPNKSHTQKSLLSYNVIIIIKQVTHNGIISGN